MRQPGRAVTIPDHWLKSVGPALSSHSNHAVVVLPPGARGRIAEPAVRRWLVRGRLRCAPPSQEHLLRVLAAISQPIPDQGLAALRLWGQTGNRPGAWIAAADPVYLEAMLDHLRLHALGAGELPLPHLRQVFEAIQQVIGEDQTRTFSRIGLCGYLRGAEAMATAAASPEIAALSEPIAFLPQGAMARSHDKLTGELQLHLHEQPINCERQLAGLRPINSLWIWGGGRAPQPARRQLPLLVSDDPLFTGYWHSCEGASVPWPGDIDACIESGLGGSVVVCPSSQSLSDEHWLCGALDRLRRALSRGKLRRLTLIFRDGLHAELRRHYALRLWRGVPDYLTRSIGP